ncbi:MAG: VOC family protein [Hyphomicrobiales bacterium]|nr:VOC family protein [Hyphomicrobiales bacterium]
MAVRSLDHAVIAAHDIDSLAGFWRRLGFNVSAQNLHPWGTRNHIIQFAGHFIELIGAGDAAKAPQRPLFADRLLGFLAERQGMAMLALTSSDAAADVTGFTAARIAAGPVFSFTRSGEGPHQARKELGFDLAFAQSSLLQQATFFTCHHRFPENFWSPAARDHANGALAIRAVMMVARDPADHAEFLRAVTGQPEMLATSFGLELRLDTASLEMLSPPAWRFATGLADAPPDDGFAGLRLATADLPGLAQRLKAENIPATLHQDRLVVAPRTAFGLALVFEAA